MLMAMLLQSEPQQHCSEAGDECASALLQAPCWKEGPWAACDSGKYPELGSFSFGGRMQKGSGLALK